MSVFVLAYEGQYCAPVAPGLPLVLFELTEKDWRYVNQLSTRKGQVAAVRRLGKATSIDALLAIAKDHQQRAFPIP